MSLAAGLVLALALALVAAVYRSPHLSFWVSFVLITLGLLAIILVLIH